MRYQPIDPALFISHRKRLYTQLKPNSLVILHANDIMPKSADGLLPFRQSSDLFYLSGIDQEETILVLYPEAPDAAWKEVLFVKKTDEQIMIWEGQKYTQEEASKASGIAHVHWLEDFPRLLHTLMTYTEHVYLNTNEHTRAVVEVETRDARFIAQCQRKYPLHQYERLAPLMHDLRAIKLPAEVALLQQACHITELGFRKLLPLVKPGVMEYELEAALIGEFVRNRSRGFAYEPIVASGHNACVLHYTANDQPCKSGDTILLDVGAEYANYSADMTRVVPVDGRFTARQRRVYDAVLRIMRQAQALLVPGSDLTTYHAQIATLVEEELVGLGLLSRTDIKKQDPKRPAYKKYFMHGTSHHLGLDTHDVGHMYRKFEPGMVFTIEPGIYIREEGLGIRLENDFLVQEDGLLDLMSSIPIEAEEIEALVQGA